MRFEVLTKITQKNYNLTKDDKLLRSLMRIPAMSIKQRHKQRRFDSLIAHEFKSPQHQRFMHFPVADKICLLQIKQRQVFINNPKFKRQLKPIICNA